MSVGKTLSFHLLNYDSCDSAEPCLVIEWRVDGFRIDLGLNITKPVAIKLSTVKTACGC